ncbi:14647_t:CDS:2, partial [Funneliformis mosseae]
STKNVLRITSSITVYKCVKNMLNAACNAISANVEKVEKNVILRTKSDINNDSGSFQNSIVVSKDETGAFTPANDALLENINKKTLEKEKQLPSINDRSSKDPLYMCENVIRSFGKYQNCIPKICRIIIPTYWSIRFDWRKPVRLGEVQALPTNNARNEKGSPFKRTRVSRRVDMKSTLVKTANKFEVIYGEVAGGLGLLGIQTACRKKRYLDILKLMIVIRDGINRLLRECKHVPNDKRTSVIIYGLELNFYAMDWCGAGIYRFGMVDHCRLPSDDSDCGILEDAYCIFKLLEERSLETEK